MTEQKRKRRQSGRSVLHLSPNLIKTGCFLGLAEENGEEEDEKHVKNTVEGKKGKAQRMKSVQGS